MAGQFADTSNISDATTADAADIKDPIDDLDTELYNLEQGDSAFTQLSVGSAGQITIATGAVTVTRSFHKVENEGAASTDTLDTINGGAEGDVLVLIPNNTSNTTTVSNGTGNIYTADGSAFSLTGRKTFSAICVDNGGTLEWWQI